MRCLEVAGQSFRRGANEQGAQIVVDLHHDALELIQPVELGGRGHTRDVCAGHGTLDQPPAGKVVTPYGDPSVGCPEDVDEALGPPQRFHPVRLRRRLLRVDVAGGDTDPDPDGRSEGSPAHRTTLAGTARCRGTGPLDCSLGQHQAQSVLQDEADRRVALERRRRSSFR